MKASPANYTKHILAAFLVVGSLAGLACGAAATATPSTKTAATPAPAAATAAPAPTTTPSPTRAPRVGETTLRVGLPFLSQPPDPVGGGLHPLQAGLMETLFRLNMDLKPEPWLATGARQLNERTWEITLRQGVKFHNGELMDASAVKASLERAVAKSPRAKVILNLSTVEVKDVSTLVIVTNNPSPILPGILTDATTGIVSVRAAEAMGDAFTDRAVLTGPFKVERFQRDKELVVVRHEEYWGPRPLVGRAVFTYVPDNNSRVLALQSGDIDMAVHIAPESVPVVQGTPGLAVATTVPIALEFIMLNHKKEPWKDLSVRQAIALAVDRDGLVKAVMQGQGSPATGPLPPAVVRCDQVRGYGFDLTRSRALLAQAGYQDKDGDGYVEKDGQPLTMLLLTYRQRPELVPLAEAVQGNLKAVGVQVKVRMVESIDSALQQADWDGGMYFNNMVVTGDPHFSLAQFFLTAGGANRGGYSNPQVDQLVGQIAQGTERGQRQISACAASQVIVDDVAVVPLLYPNFNYGLSRKVTGFDTPHPWFGYIVDSQIGKR